MKYDIIVIGAGAGGLNIASFMNKVGFNILLVDRSDANIGGDCLNFGCIPSKALIHAAKLAHYVKESNKFGLKTNGNIDISKVMNYIKSKQDFIRKHENAQYFKDKGMDVVLGNAKFIGKNLIQVNESTYEAKKIVIATGSKPRVLNIPGVDKIIQYNNENIFQLKSLPKKLLIIGGGPIGIELAQAFNRLGSHVSVIQRGPRFLPREEKEISDVLLEQLKKEGIQFFFNSKPEKFLSEKEVIIKNDKGDELKLDFDTVLVAIGRELEFKGLNLESADIKLDKSGRKIQVNDYLQTTNKNVYLCGDIVGSYQFTHVAELHASVILNNLFSPLKKKVNYDKISWVTYTDPEIANYGLNEQQLKTRNIKYEKLVLDFDEDDRHIVDSSNGKLIMYISKNKILGATMVAPNAGELIQEIVLAGSSNLDIKNIFNKTHAYPTASRVNKKIISNYFSKKLTSFAKKTLHFMYKLR